MVLWRWVRIDLGAIRAALQGRGVAVPQRGALGIVNGVAPYGTKAALTKECSYSEQNRRQKQRW